MGIDRGLSEAVASAGDIAFSVAALEAIVKMNGYSDQTIASLLRIFRHHFPLASERTSSIIQRMEDCLKKCCADPSAAPFRIPLLTVLL